MQLKSDFKSNSCNEENDQVNDTMYNSMKKIIELNSSLWNKFIVDVSTYQRFTGNLY